MQGKQYIQTPRIDKFVCRLAGAESEEPPATAPTSSSTAIDGSRRLLADSEAAGAEAALSTLQRHQAQRAAGKGPQPKQFGGLPTLEGFTFEEHVTFNGIAAEKWTYALHVEATTGHYEYIITPQGKPLRLHMLGGELALNSHFDEYVLDFVSFEALDATDGAPFALPGSCHDLDGARTGRPVSLVLASLVPGGTGVRPTG